MSDSLRGALTAAEEEARHLNTAHAQARQVRQELKELRDSHEAVQSELASARGRLSAFDDSCKHSLDRVGALSAALQEAQQAKVCCAAQNKLCVLSVMGHKRPCIQQWLLGFSLNLIVCHCFAVMHRMNFTSLGRW